MTVLVEPMQELQICELHHAIDGFQATHYNYCSNMYVFLFSLSGHSFEFL
jgi:hypothetical protein